MGFNKVFMIFSYKLYCSNEIDRNRRKVMEINFFLDNQQIKFDQLTTDVGAEIEKSEEFDELSLRKSVSEIEMDDSLLDGDLEEEEGDDEFQLQSEGGENEAQD